MKYTTSSGINPAIKCPMKGKLKTNFRSRSESGPNARDRACWASSDIIYIPNAS